MTAAGCDHYPASNSEPASRTGMRPSELFVLATKASQRCSALIPLPSGWRYEAEGRVYVIWPTGRPGLVADVAGNVSRQTVTRRIDLALACCRRSFANGFMIKPATAREVSADLNLARCRILLVEWQLARDDELDAIEKWMERLR